MINQSHADVRPYRAATWTYGWARMMAICGQWLRENDREPWS